MKIYKYQALKATKYLTKIWNQELYGPGKIYKIEFSLNEEEYFALKATI